MPLTVERLREVLPRVTETLHDLARAMELTNDELLAALAFLGEVGRADETILLSDVLGLSRLVDDQTHGSADGTPSNVLGPFYRPGAPWIDNPGSVVAAGDRGARIRVSGRISDARSGAALPGAVVDLWQANAEGVYSNEDSALDPWNLRGRQRADAGGVYRFETVRPLHYTVKHDGPVGRLLVALDRHPWRPAHIHYLVTAKGYEPLVTQVYLAGGPYLTDDTINAVKEELVSEVRDGALRFDLALVAE